jgi:hypothetical protein
MEVFLAIGASVYVDGVERYREPSWTDSRPVPLLLVEDYQPGTPLHLAVRANAGDGFGFFVHANLRASALAEAIFELDLLAAQLNFTHFLRPAQRTPRVARSSARGSGLRPRCRSMRWPRTIGPPGTPVRPRRARSSRRLRTRPSATRPMSSRTATST